MRLVGEAEAATERARLAARIVAETDGLVAFGDGIEADRLTLAWGQEARLRVAPERLRLTV